MTVIKVILAVLATINLRQQFKTHFAFTKILNDLFIEHTNNNCHKKYTQTQQNIFTLILNTM